MSASRDRVWAVALPVVEAAGYDLDDLSVMAAGRRRLVRVMIDSDHGVDLDDAAAVSRAVSDALDESDAMGETPYVLEVTSRGVGRPLTLPRHWRRAQTRLVAFTTVDESGADEGANTNKSDKSEKRDKEKDDKRTGRVVDSDDVSVTLLIDDVELVVPYDQIVNAVVQVEFNRRAVPDADDLADFDDADAHDETDRS